MTLMMDKGKVTFLFKITSSDKHILLYEGHDATANSVYVVLKLFYIPEIRFIVLNLK